MQSLSQWAKASGVTLFSPEATMRLQAAYVATFSGNATREDAEIALVDLAVMSRFYEHMTPDAAPDALRHIDGRRAVFRQIIGFIADPRILGELQVAALAEAIVTESQTRKARK